MILKTGSLDDWCIIVTGAAGFIGRRLVPLCVEAGATVIAIDTGTLVSWAIDAVLHVKGDFREKEDEVLALMQSAQKQYTAVIHLAGMAHVGECEKYPQKAFDANVGLTASVLEFCRKHGIRRIIFPSTGLVYGDQHQEAVTEDVVPNPPHLYAATKLAAEALVQGYSRSYGFSGISARLANVYGPNGNPDTIVSLVVQKIRTGEEVMVRDVTPVRDFIYVDDVAESFLHLLLLDDPLYSGVVNVSTGVRTSIAMLIETACAVAGRPLTTEHSNSKTTPVSSLVLDNGRFQQLTGWVPGTLADGLSIMLKG